MTNKKTFKTTSVKGRKEKQSQRMNDFRSKYNLKRSFVLGVSSLFFSPSSGAEFLGRSDSKALRSDWNNVGEDLYTALKEYHHELSK